MFKGMVRIVADRLDECSIGLQTTWHVLVCQRATELLHCKLNHYSLSPEVTVTYHETISTMPRFEFFDFPCVRR